MNYYKWEKNIYFKIASSYWELFDTVMSAMWVYASRYTCCPGLTSLSFYSCLLGNTGPCLWFHILEYFFDRVIWHCYSWSGMCWIVRCLHTRRRSAGDSAWRHDLFREPGRRWWSSLFVAIHEEWMALISVGRRIPCDIWSDRHCFTRETWSYECTRTRERFLWLVSSCGTHREGLWRRDKIWTAWSMDQNSTVKSTSFLRYDHWLIHYPFSTMELGPFAGLIYAVILIVDCLFFLILEWSMPRHDLDFVRMHWDHKYFAKVCDNFHGSWPVSLILHLPSLP